MEHMEAHFLLMKRLDGKHDAADAVLEDHLIKIGKRIMAG